MAHEHACHKRFWLLGAAHYLYFHARRHISRRENQVLAPLGWHTAATTTNAGRYHTELIDASFHETRLLSSLIRRRFPLFTGLIITFLTPHDSRRAQLLISHVPRCIPANWVAQKLLCTDFLSLPQTRFIPFTALSSRGMNSAQMENEVSNCVLLFVVKRTLSLWMEVIECVWALLSLSWQRIPLIDWSSGIIHCSQLFINQAQCWILVWLYLRRNLYYLCLPLWRSLNLYKRDEAFVTGKS